CPYRSDALRSHRPPHGHENRPARGPAGALGIGGDGAAMDLIGVDGKRLLSNAGLAVPGNQRLVRSGEKFTTDRPVVVKAQLPAGGRGKAGLVRLADPGNAAEAVSEVLASLGEQGRIPLVLVEDQIAFE